MPSYLPGAYDAGTLVSITQYTIACYDDGPEMGPFFLHRHYSYSIRPHGRADRMPRIRRTPDLGFALAEMTLYYSLR
ncbi:MAG: hypothetical protein ACFFFY_12135 [Promethearchaeota archaeon]